MEEFVAVTVVSNPGESEQDFSARLSLMWTGMLREHKDEFEMVFAETTEFEEEKGCLTRTYLCEEPVLDLVESKFKGAGIDYQPIDRDDTYSQYEAVSPDWMQIEH